MVIKKIIAYSGLILLMLLAAWYMVFNNHGFMDAYDNARMELDLERCNDIPAYKHSVVMKDYGFMGGSVPEIMSQREKCRDNIQSFFHLYAYSDEDTKDYFEALKQNKPELCPQDGSFKCLDDIRERYKDPAICSYYRVTEFDKEYQKYTHIFGCQSYLIIFEKQDSKYCDQYDGDIRNYCYFSIAREYNRLMRMKHSPLVIHQAADGKQYFKPRPTIPIICNDIEDSAFKSSCEYVFDDFNSWGNISVGTS